MSDIIVKSIRSGDIENNTYIVYKKGSKSGLVIDPSHGLESIENAIKVAELEEIAVLLTHGHFDHAESSSQLQKKFGAKVYISREDADKLGSKLRSLAIVAQGCIFENHTADVLLEDNQEFELFRLKIKVILTPGHSKGSCCFIIDDMIFSGDTIFYGSYGRYDFYDGDFNSLYDSIVNKIFALQGEYTIYCGHGEPTSLSFEKKNNMILADFR